MSRIELARVFHRYGQTVALEPLDASWDDGGAYALLGPSGCGKTTLLGVISGLLRPSGGRVLLDGKDMTDRAARARNVAQVFQFPVVYDTMSVFENLAFPLRNRGLPASRVRRRVGEIAELLHLTALLPRLARGLSAETKQRISLARGLVREDVSAVLLDEPLAVIDWQQKWNLRRTLKEIHHALQVTMIYVTHDQEEALTFADRVMVMHNGRIVQEGSPSELFERPATPFVGHFIGSPGMNALSCTLEEEALLVEGSPVILDPERIAQARRQGTTFRVGIRPERIELAAESRAGALAGTVESCLQRSTHRIVKVRLGAAVVTVNDRSGRPWAAGDRAHVYFPPQHLVLFADDERVGG